MKVDKIISNIIFLIGLICSLVPYFLTLHEIKDFIDEKIFFWFLGGVLLIYFSGYIRGMSSGD